MAVDALSCMLASDASADSPFFRLPTEVRLMIYEHLLVRSTHALDVPQTTSFASIMPTAPDYYRYEPSSGASTPTTSSTHTLKIRTEDPLSYAQRQPTHLRSHFLIKSDRFRARCMPTTYHLLSNPSLHPSILGASQRIHAEAAETFFSQYTFDFDTHVEAVIPFLSDLTPHARSCVRSIRLVKRALPYEKEFDRAEWAAALEYIAEHVPIQALSLGIVAGKPGPNGWDFVVPYGVVDWEFVKDMDGMEWVRDLLGIKTLKSLEVDAVVEHCPPPMSTAMARYIKFSASVDGSFAEFLRGRMLA